MGAGIAASPHCTERRIRQVSKFSSRGTCLRTFASPAQASLSINPLSPEREARLTYLTAWPEGSLLFQSAWPDPKVKTDRWSAALLGMISTASRFASFGPKTAGSRVARSKDHLFRRLVPAGRASTSRRKLSASPAAEIGPLVTCRSVLPLPAAWRGEGPPSRSPDDYVPFARVAKVKTVSVSLWITWISGTTTRAAVDQVRLPEAPPHLTSALCQNPRNSRPSRRTFRASTRPSAKRS